jgi:hypothetical protein
MGASAPTSMNDIVTAQCTQTYMSQPPPAQA